MSTEENTSNNSENTNQKVNDLVSIFKGLSPIAQALVFILLLLGSIGGYQEYKNKTISAWFEKNENKTPSHFIVQGRLVDQDNNALKNQKIIVNTQDTYTDQNGKFSASGVRIGADAIIQFSIGTETLNKDSTQYLIQGNIITINQNLKIEINKKGRK